MDPLVTSSLIKVGGSLLGGAFGKKGSSWKDKWATFENQQIMEQKAMRNKMQMAKEHKIHPLTMLGAQTPQISLPVHDSRSSMGQNIAKSISDGASNYFTGKANKEMNDLAIERAQLENELLRTQISSINNPSQAGKAYSNDSRVIDQTSKDDLMDKFKYRGKDVPVALGEMGEISQAYTDITETVPKILLGQIKDISKWWYKKNKFLFRDKKDMERSYLKFIRKQIANLKEK